jgi:hypothetical protein
MHPLIARFLDLPATVAVLEKGEVPGLDSDEVALLAAAARAPRERAAIVASKDRAQPSNEVQQQAIVLATRAATARLRDDAALGPKAAAAVSALLAEGATADEAEALISQVLLEEAFGYASDPSHFDEPYVAETLDSLVPLSKLSSEVVDDWLDAFAKGGAREAKVMRLSVAETLLEAAWAEGPQPISFEALDDALDHLADSVATTELSTARAALEELLGFLASRGVIGPERVQRLVHHVKSTASEARDDSDEAEDGEEAEEED